MSDKVILNKCKTWLSFIDAIRTQLTDNDSASFLFRGQSSQWLTLQSTWERSLRYRLVKNPTDNIRDAHAQDLSDRLHKFQDYARGLPSVSTSGMDSDDWLCLARHHGLLSPLLDWTHNPYVATFFACIDVLEETSPGIFSGQTGRLFKYPTSDVNVWALPSSSLDNHKDIRLVANRLDSFHRQRAQFGVFTELSHPNCIDVIEFYDKHVPEDSLSCFVLPSSEVGKALFDLNIMGINFASLFPDLDGAAKQANLELLFANIWVLS